MPGYTDREAFSTATMRLVSYNQGGKGFLSLFLKDDLGTICHGVSPSWGNDFRALGITCHDELPLAVGKEVQVHFNCNRIPELVAPPSPPRGSRLRPLDVSGVCVQVTFPLEWTEAGVALNIGHREAILDALVAEEDITDGDWGHLNYCLWEVDHVPSEQEVTDRYAAICKLVDLVGRPPYDDLWYPGLVKETREEYEALRVAEASTTYHGANGSSVTLTVYREEGGDDGVSR